MSPREGAKLLLGRTMLLQDLRTLSGDAVRSAERNIHRDEAFSGNGRSGSLRNPFAPESDQSSEANRYIKSRRQASLPEREIGSRNGSLALPQGPYLGPARGTILSL